MRILITGAGGFIGQNLIRTLLREGHLADRDGQSQPIGEIVALDKHLPEMSDARITLLQEDITSPQALGKIGAQKFDSIFHLAAILTSEAERQPARALGTNVSALAALIETIRSEDAPPRVIFPSSLAVFGGLLPDIVDDDHVRRPQTTYGTHKAIAELMLADSTRHGIIDSRTLRLPIVMVHPGPPTLSVSDRIAAVVREATAGRDVVCPLRNDTRVPVVSVQTVVRNLINLHNLEKAKLRGKRAFNQPALTVSMDDIAASIARVRNGKAPGKITFAPDTELKQIVDGWPKGFISTRAASIGTMSDRSFDDIIAGYLKGLQDAQDPSSSADIKAEAARL